MSASGGLLWGGVCLRGVSALGGCLLQGVSALGGLSTSGVVCFGGGLSTSGGVCLGGSASGGVCSRGVSALGGGVCSQGGCIPACTEADTPPLTESQTPVKTLPWPNFVAAGNYQKYPEMK